MSCDVKLQVAMKIFYMHACSLSPFTSKMIRRDREMQRRSFETALVYLFIIKPVLFRWMLLKLGTGNGEQGTGNGSLGTSVQR